MDRRDCLIHLTRIYDAPVQAVWDAWVDPQQVAQWWGPRGFTLTTRSKDVRVGGSWDYTMHGPDGTDYPNLAKYFEVEKYARLVYDHGGTHDKPALFRVAVNFAELQGKTKMDMTMTLPTPEAAAATRSFIKQAGGDATWDRLAEFLAQRSTNKEIFVITRVFDAPIETVFEKWVNPQHLANWLAPTGLTMRFTRADIRVGSSTLYSMTDGEHYTLHGTAKYLEIVRPKRLVYTQQFCDAQERLTRHPLAPTWPETMLTTVLFSEEGAHRTRIKITWEPLGAITPLELGTFVHGRSGMTQGWTGSLDKLENYLS